MHAVVHACYYTMHAVVHACYYTMLAVVHATTSLYNLCFRLDFVHAVAQATTPCMLLYMHATTPCMLLYRLLHLACCCTGYYTMHAVVHATTQAGNRAGRRYHSNNGGAKKQNMNKSLTTALYTLDIGAGLVKIK